MKMEPPLKKHMCYYCMPYPSGSAPFVVKSHDRYAIYFQRRTLVGPPLDLHHKASTELTTLSTYSTHLSTCGQTPSCSFSHSIPANTAIYQCAFAVVFVISVPLLKERVTLLKVSQLQTLPITNMALLKFSISVQRVYLSLDHVTS